MANIAWIIMAIYVRVGWKHQKSQFILSTSNNGSLIYI